MECNQMKARETLERIDMRLVSINCIDSVQKQSIDRCRMLIKQALSAPPRNCDVGTADEQAQRFHNFCVGNSSGINGMCKPTCPCIDCFDKCQCLTKWAQTPYAEGGKQ